MDRKSQIANRKWSIRPATDADREVWARMRNALWPAGPGEHAAEIEQYFQGGLEEPLEVLLAFDDRGNAVGMIELSIRPYAEGCTTDRVAYVEGWYVEPHARRRGVGAALVRAAEDWGRAQGCTELGSDAESGNDVSVRAHLALGFENAGTVRCFRKAI